MIRLFYNYYSDKNQERKKEIDFCFYKNICNKEINLIVIESDKRLKYNDYFEKINILAKPDDISIICNADIFLDETITKVNSIKHDEVYALSRWDYSLDGTSKFWDRPDSQDTWIFRGKVRPVDGDFYLGVPGCDNRIAFEFGKSGYKVINPSISIKTYHVHNSKIRNYNKSTEPVPPPYHTVAPVSI